MFDNEEGFISFLQDKKADVNSKAPTTRQEIFDFIIKCFKDLKIISECYGELK
jgi:hypothetical protein